jgi:hypothetical protein
MPGASGKFEKVLNIVWVTAHNRLGYRMDTPLLVGNMANE